MIDPSAPYEGPPVSTSKEPSSSRVRRRIVKTLRKKAGRSRVFWWSAGQGARTVGAVTRSSRWMWRAGVANERLGRTEMALAAYRTAVDRGDLSMSQYLRIAAIYEQQGATEQARAVLRLSLDRAPTKADYRLRKARLRSREADWEGAAEEYRKALELAGERADLLAGLAKVYRRMENHAAALDAYERAIACTTGATPGIRYELASFHDQTASWPEAIRVLLENIRQHPAHGPSYRLLSKIYGKMSRWNGFFEWQSSGGPGRFTRLHAGHPTLAEIGSDNLLEKARLALLRAIDLSGDNPSWFIDLGSLYLDSGMCPQALEAFEKAHALARAGTSQNVKVSIHPAQFGVERVSALKGEPQASDLLFDVTTDVVELTVEDTQPYPGAFDVWAEHDGLRVGGMIPATAAERIEIWLDDLILRRVNVSSNGYLSSFRFRIRRSALEHFPEQSVLSVRTEGGARLLARGRGMGLSLRVPSGSGELRDALAEGRVFDKKGVLAPSEIELRQIQDEFLELYTEVRTFLERTFGKQLLLFYGNLLGFYRDGGFIPGDDDFDVGYVSDELGPTAVKTEAMRIMAALVEEGYTVSVNRRGALFRVQRADSGVHLSVRQAWFHGGKAWILRYANFPAVRSDFLPPQEGDLNGTKVLIPAEPERFLAGHYGPGWKFPDPGFRYYSANVPSKALKYLHKARMTPLEFERLQKSLHSKRRGVHPRGRLVSLAEQSLYPLELYIE